MNLQSRLFPLSDTHESQIAAISRQFVSSTTWDDATFFRLCLGFDTDAKRAKPNWNAVFGLGLATAVSLSFWAGVGFVISRLL